MDRFRNTRQPAWDWWGRLWPAPGETLRTLGIGAGDRLAEVASGNGYFALPAAALVAPAPTYAVDLDDDHLAEIDHLADQQQLETITTVQGDARDLGSLLPHPVDVVTIANTLHGVDDVASLAREAFAALADDGRLVVVNWHDRPREETTVDGQPRGPPTERRMGPAETVDAVGDGVAVGVDRRVELPPYHYGLVFVRRKPVP